MLKWPTRSLSGYGLVEPNAPLVFWMMSPGIPSLPEGVWLQLLKGLIKAQSAGGSWPVSAAGGEKRLVTWGLKHPENSGAYFLYWVNYHPIPLCSHSQTRYIGFWSNRPRYKHSVLWQYAWLPKLWLFQDCCYQNNFDCVKSGGMFFNEMNSFMLPSFLGSQ